MFLWLPAFIGNAGVQVLKGGNGRKVRLVVLAVSVWEEVLSLMVFLSCTAKSTCLHNTCSSSELMLNVISVVSLPSSYPENGVVQMSSANVRARARTILKWHQLEVGQVVMVNYNPDEPKERGFWYDAEILQKRETKMTRELNAKILLG